MHRTLLPTLLPTRINIDSDIIHMKPRLILYIDRVRMSIVNRALFPIVYLEE